MIAHDDNNPAASFNLQSAQAATLRDLRDLVAKADMPAAESSQVRSAIKRVDEIVGHGALDLPADLKFLLTKLEQISPAMAGMSDQAFANMKSRLRKAFRLVKPQLPKARASVTMTKEWQAIYHGLPNGRRLALSRFFHIASECNWKPTDISDAHIERFAAYLRDDAAVIHWDDVVRRTIKEWNRLGEATLTLQRLTPPPAKRSSYWLRVEDLPQGLQDEIARFLEQLAEPMTSIGPAERKPKPGTIGQYRYAIITLVSAIAASGAVINDLQKLGDVVKTENLLIALRFLRARYGAITRGMEILVARAFKIAKWAHLPSKELSGIERLLDEVRPAQRRKMTEKNSRLIDQLDDLRFRSLVVNLPFILLRRARNSRNERMAAQLVRSATAVELLLTCALRAENLTTLELDKTIRKVGHGSRARWIIDIAGDDVKNGEPLHFVLREGSAKILDEYLATWRPKLCTKATAWLFPDKTGKVMSQKVLASAIGVVSARETGVRITPHQFRHISAELLLREQPEAMATVTDHLGHRDVNTARRYYAKPKQREANRVYQDALLIHREQASILIWRRPKRKPSSKA